jgi:putative hydrolase of the HAD superfamily
VYPAVHELADEFTQSLANTQSAVHSSGVAFGMRRHSRLGQSSAGEAITVSFVVGTPTSHARPDSNGASGGMAASGTVILPPDPCSGHPARTSTSSTSHRITPSSHDLPATGYSGNPRPVFRALLLDLDDTLYDRGAAFRAWAHRIAHEQRGSALDDAELGRLCVLDERGHRPRHELAADAAAELGLAIDHVAFSAQLAEHVIPEPGAREALVQLGTSRRLAVVTNGGAAQRTKLARLGLADVVHEVFVSSEVGIAKPEVAIFERALAWTGCSAAEVLFVGDHPWIDLAPAAALGMATAWRERDAWPRELAPPTWRIGAVAELLEVCV